jgi:hypothetical protein
LTNGTRLSLASYQWPDHCWRASDGTINGDCGVEIFVAKVGNAGPGTVSFASGSKFWRHRDGKLFLEQSDGSALFTADSSWLALSGLHNPGLVSFRSVNYPNFFIRHINGRLAIAAWDGSTQLSEDATFRVQVHAL